MNVNDDHVTDPLDPLAPRPDDPRIGRWWGQTGSRRPADSPLAIVGMTAVSIVSAALATTLLLRCGSLG